MPTLALTFFFVHKEFIKYIGLKWWREFEIPMFTLLIYFVPFTY